MTIGGKSNENDRRDDIDTDIDADIDPDIDRHRHRRRHRPTSTSTPKPKTELHQDRFRVGFSGISKSDWDRIFGDSKDSNEKLANARVTTGRKTRR